jgi:hypothetical protein
MAMTKEMIDERGAKTGVTRMFESSGTPEIVTDPCLATAAEEASRRVSVTLAPSGTVPTVARAVVSPSGDETGAAASLTATATGSRVPCGRDAGYLTAARDAAGDDPGSGMP